MERILMFRQDRSFKLINGSLFLFALSFALVNSASLKPILNDMLGHKFVETKMVYVYASVVLFFVVSFLINYQIIKVLYLFTELERVRSKLFFIYLSALSISSLVMFGLRLGDLGNDKRVIINSLLFALVFACVSYFVNRRETHRRKELVIVSSFGVINLILSLIPILFRMNV